jgi:hypothetical protein
LTAGRCCGYCTFAPAGQSFVEKLGGATIPGMATKQRVIQLIDSLPDTPETDVRLDAIADQIERTGPDDEGPIPTLEEVSAIFAGVDFLPREDAWH